MQTVLEVVARRVGLEQPNDIYDSADLPKIIQRHGQIFKKIQGGDYLLTMYESQADVNGEKLYVDVRTFVRNGQIRVHARNPSIDDNDLKMASDELPCTRARFLEMFAAVLRPNRTVRQRVADFVKRNHEEPFKIMSNVEGRVGLEKPDDVTAEDLIEMTDGSARRVPAELYDALVDSKVVSQFMTFEELEDDITVEFLNSMSAMAREHPSFHWTTIPGRVMLSSIMIYSKYGSAQEFIKELNRDHHLSKAKAQVLKFKRAQ